MTPRGGNGWSSPQIIVAIISLLMAAGGSYLALQRDDSERVAKQIETMQVIVNEHTRDLAINRTRIEYLERERERRGE